MAEAKPADKPKGKIQLGPAGLHLAEHRRSVYQIVVPAGTTLEDMLDPQFFAHVANKLRPTDRIEVEEEEGAFYAELRVQACEKTWARVQKIAFIDLSAPLAPLSQEIIDSYEVKQRAGEKWCVIRKSDNAVLHSGLHTKAAATEWLADYLGNA